MTRVVNESGDGPVRGEETNASEPLITCRKTLDVIETRCAAIIEDKPGGSLPTAQVVTGIKAA